MIFETERLIVRQLQQDDFQDLAQILKNPQVMYAYERTCSDEDVQIWLDRQRQRYQQYGFGLWALILKESGEMVGQAGLSMQPYKERDVLEIGYLLKEKFWHCGYASEAAAGCRDYAFQQLQAERVYSMIKVDNLPSIRVAERIGMKKEDTFITRYYNGDMLHFLYSLHKRSPV